MRSHSTPESAPPGGRRAAIYTRTVTVARDGSRSLDAQGQRCYRHAERRGYAVAPGDVSSDGASGNTLSRPGLGALRERVRQGEVDVIVAAGPERMARDVNQLAIIEDECRRAGVGIEYAEGAPS